MNFVNFHNDVAAMMILETLALVLLLLVSLEICDYNDVNDVV